MCDCLISYITQCRVLYDGPMSRQSAFNKCENLQIWPGLVMIANMHGDSQQMPATALTPAGDLIHDWEAYALPQSGHRISAPSARKPRPTKEALHL